MLRQGGNAVDAAVCAAATMAVVLPSLNGVGGDLFAQVWRPGQPQPDGLNASGRSGSLARIDRLQSMGCETVPKRGPLSINVPGAVSGWQELLARYGTRRLRDVLDPAIDYARGGAPVTAYMAASIRASSQLVLGDPGMRAVFSHNGRLLEEGEVFINRDLAGSLESLARTDGESIYRGELAEALASGLANAESFILREDLQTHQAEWVRPLSTTFCGREIYELPPNCQGVAALEMLNMYRIDNGHRTLPHNSIEYVESLCRYIAFSIEDRDRYISDPQFVQIPIDRLTSIEYARERLSHGQKAPSSGDRSDTIYLCVVDSDRLAVSLIQSQYQGFGSGLMVAGTGIHMNNRGSYFSADPSNVNSLEPRKRTMHTLMPGMAGRNGAAEMTFGSMGGDAQPQIHLQLLLNRYIFGMDVQESIEAPRFAWSPQKGLPKRILLESRFPQVTVNGLRDRGWTCHLVGRWSSEVGHAQAVAIHDGTLKGGADPRADSAAIGF